MPGHEQPSPTTVAALSLRALAEAQAEPQPVPRTRRAKARLVLAALLGIALIIFCVSGLLVIATGRAQSATPPAPTNRPTPTATVIGSGPSFIGRALTNATSRPYLDRRVPALASPSASTSAPAATPAPRAGAALPAAPIASAGMSGTLEAANALGSPVASGDALLASPMLSATLTLTPAGGLCTGTQTITNPTSYRVSWFWRQLAIGGFVLPATFRYALDGGASTAGLPHDTALAAGATDIITITMPCDGNIYVLTLVDDLGHAVGFFMQAPR
jgi:hypothetical protein